MLAAGSKLGRYEIRFKIGEGGMGEVYQATDLELGRTVALKILPPDVASQRVRLQRFIVEAKAASALNHPHILTIYEIGTADNVHFIATEFVEGETLQQRTKTGLTLAQTLEIAIQIAGALSAAHAAGIIHRDIKPHNIMVRPDGYAKLLDFGLAKLLEPDGLASDPEAPTKAMVHTDAGIVVGTANYMSPEQAKGLPVDARTDLWSLGVVLYEIVTGQVPFLANTATETLALILQREPSPLKRYADEVPTELERIVAKALSKDREERYQTAKDLLIDLRNLKRTLEVNAEIDRTASPELQTTSQPAQLTSSGHVETTASSAEYIVSKIKDHKLATLLAVLILVSALVAIVAYTKARKPAVAFDSIAVLPFETQGADEDSEYLSYGLTESIIYRLSQLPSLKVSPTSTVFTYKGQKTNAVKVGNDLGVSAVLTGRIVKYGDNLTISAELVEVSGNRLLWGERYDRKMSDLLATQREIAREIVEKLKLKVSGQEGALSTQYTENQEAYQLYLKGRFYWNKRTFDGLNKSILYFNQSIEKDPGFALAYAGLADSYVVPINRLFPKEAMPKAKAAAMRALELDESLAEAHTTLGRVFAQYEWNWPAAEKEYKRAIELNPRYAIAHQWYGGYLECMDRPDEALKERQLALELDPLSPIINFELSLAYYFRRDYDRAIDQFKKTLELNPDFPPVHQFLPAAYEQKGMYDEALAGFKKAVSLQGTDAQYAVAGLGHLYAITGRKSEAEKQIAELKQVSQQQYVRSSYIALIYAGLGDKDQAFAWLEKGFEERGFQMTNLKLEPRFDVLRSDPRFKDLARRLGLPE